MKLLPALAPFALLGLGALTAPDASAQVRSNTQGFFLEGSVGGTSVRIDDGDEEGDDDSGGALGVRLGYGLSQRFAIYAALGGAAIEPEGDAFEAITGSDTYGLGNVDLGLEVNFGRPTALVPYANVALSGVAARFESEDVDADATFSGGGLTLGGGLKYHFTPAFALNGSLQFYGGAFNRLEVDGEELDGDDFEDLFGDVSYRGARLGVGLTWYPGR